MIFLLKALKETPEDIKLIIAGRPQRDDITYYDRLIDELALQDRVIKIIRYIEDDEREKLFFLQRMSMFCPIESSIKVLCC